MDGRRHSTWSSGNFAAWPRGEATCAKRGDCTYANVSPGTMAIVQTVISMYRKVTLKKFHFRFMAPSVLDHPLAPGGSIEHACSHCFIIFPRRAAPSFDTRSYRFLAVLAKITVGVSAHRTARGKS